ncbi:MAG: hypothetical protein ACOZIN_18580 [Myxococcota bacterium]
MKWAPWFLGAGLVLLLLLPSSAEACAGCSNPNLPAGRSSHAELGAGRVTATFFVTGTYMNVVHSDFCPDIGPICQQRDEPGQLHDQTFYIGELRPILDVGLTETFGVEAQIPFRITRTTIVFRRLDGAAFVPDYEHIHHRTETLAGPADPWLLARGIWRLGSWSLTARSGLSLPLGRTEPNPFALGRAGQPHQHIQFGNGTVNPVLGLDVARQWERVRLSAYGQTVLFFYQNHYGYQAGNRYLGGVAAEASLLPKLRVTVGADLLNEQPERWDGAVQQDGNVGRTDLLLGGMVGYAFDPVTALLSVKAPVWQQFIRVGEQHDADPGQLTYPAIVHLAVQRTWDELF